jgi:hypothetical protein
MTIMLPVALYGCETQSLILMKEHRLRISETMVLMECLDRRGIR